MRVRTYGTSGPQVILLHGGPGAPGYMAPVARKLASRFRVIEPFQAAQTVSQHVTALDELLDSACGGAAPALVGHSWGAMLALAYAAEYPRRIASLVLIGCGAFDRESREWMQVTRDQRMDETLRRRLARLTEEIPDPDERLRLTGELLLPVYSCDLIEARLETEACDGRAHHESWNDMVRLQDQAVYPAAFAAIHAPVLMLHGTVDPHPGRMIRASLVQYLPQLEYREWARCGHYPWLEKAVREEFFAVLQEWLARRFSGC